MNVTARKLTLAAVALAALIVAGSVGAIIRATVFRVSYHQWAYLAGTSNVYCRSFTQLWTPASKDALSFNCYFLPPGVHLLSAGYAAWINRNGVTIDRYQQGNGKLVRQFDNPGLNVAKNPGQITITLPSTLARAAPGKP